MIFDTPDGVVRVAVRDVVAKEFGGLPFKTDTSGSWTLPNGFVAL
jgi:hypothetical protein